MSSVNGSVRSCRTGARRLRMTSGSVEIVSVTAAELLAALSSGVLLVTVAAMVTVPAVAGVSNWTLKAGLKPGGTSPRLQQGAVGTLEVTETFTSLAMSGPGLWTVNVTL